MSCAAREWVADFDRSAVPENLETYGCVQSLHCKGFRIKVRRYSRNLDARGEIKMTSRTYATCLDSASSGQPHRSFGHVSGSPLVAQAIAASPRPVLIVEDHPLVGEAMRDVLARSAGDLEPHLCLDAPAALCEISDPHKNWFRIFLDLDVPGAHGLSLAREIRRLGLHDRCCIVSGSDKQHLIEETRRLGFLGYIVKAIPSVQFASALSRVLVGEKVFPSTTASTNQPLIRLTRRQEQLLDCVQRGMSSKDIARALFLSEGTVNNGITAAMKALSVTSRSHALAKAFELGLLGVNASHDTAPSGRFLKGV